MSPYSFKETNTEELQEFYQSIKQDLTHIQSVCDVEKFCLDMQVMSKELCRVLFLDNQNAVIGQMEMFGSTSHCTVYPRDIFYQAMVKDASGIMVIHNHPGGSPNASEADWDLTEQLILVGRALNIDVVDHCIAHGQGLTAMRSQLRWSRIK